MGTGHLVIRTLAGFGQAALDPVMAKLQSEGGVAKQGACVVLGLLLDPANPASIKDPAARKRIKDALKKAAQDMAGAYVRAAAAEGLARLDDPDIVPFLSNLAATDGYDASNVVGTEGDFPVRKAAMASLRSLGANSSSPASQDALDALAKLGLEGPASVRGDAVDLLKGLAAGGPGTPGAGKDEAKKRLQKVLFGAPKKPEGQQ
jgi:HEAT repeat protein